MAKIFDRGEQVLIESQPKKQNEFGELEAIDPSAFTVTVTDAGGTTQIDAVSMVQSTTGKWYYVIETAVGWAAGYVRLQFDTTYESKNDKLILRRAFELI